MSGDTVYAVASGKGGVGKTTTTVNLGTAIAAAGNRVVIVDADLGMANLAGFVNCSPDGATLHDVLAGDADVDAALYEVAEGIAVVPSGTDLERYADVDAAGLGGVVDRLRSEFDYVLLDVGAGVSHETVLPLGLADSVVVVVTPEPGAVTDAQKTVDLVDRADGTTRGVVLNKTRPDDNVAGSDVAEHVGADLLGGVPEDSLVRESLQTGTPLVAYDPESPASVGFRALAATLVDGVPAPDRTPEEAAEQAAADRTADGTPDDAAADSPGDEKPADDSDAEEPADDAGADEPAEDTAADDAGPVLLDDSKDDEQADPDDGAHTDAGSDDPPEILGAPDEEPAPEDGAEAEDAVAEGERAGEEAAAETDAGETSTPDEGSAPAIDDGATADADDDPEDAGDEPTHGDADDDPAEGDSEAVPSSEEDLSADDIPFRADDEDDSGIEFDEGETATESDDEDDESRGFLARLFGR